MVLSELGISTSTAYDYITIYRNLIDSGVSWNEIEHIGWTKIRWIAKYITQDNVKQWIQIAGEKNAIELREFAKSQAKQVGNAATASPYDSELISEVSTQVDTKPVEDNLPDHSPQSMNTAPLVTEHAAFATSHNKLFQLYP